MAYRICAVVIAALLAGPALAGGAYSSAPQGSTTFDSGANTAAPGSDDGSIVNPDGDYDADNGDSSDDDDSGGGSDDGAPVTYPA